MDLEEVNKKTLEGLKEYREKNWNKKLSRKEAYKKYLEGEE